MLREFLQGPFRCREKWLDLSSPRVMGIINVTPDSFYAPSRTGVSIEEIVSMAGQMIRDGASILDIGAMSSRPGAVEISEEDEWKRLAEPLFAIRKAFPEVIISVDTYRAFVARNAADTGADMINDISGGQLDPGVWNVIAENGMAYVLMHMRGTLGTMQQNTHYEDFMGELIKYFVTRLRALTALGIRDILLDPGFGFSKTMEHNYAIIDKLDTFRFLGFPLMIGVSRKSTLAKTIDRPAEDTLEATTALHMAALLNGANILRVHDVKPATDAIAVYRHLINSKNP